MSSSAIACRTASHVPRQYFGTRVQLLLDKGKLSEGEGDDLCAAGEDEVRAVWGTSVEKCLLSQSLLKHYPQAADPQMCTSQTQVSHSAAGNRSGVQPPTVLNLLSLANAGQWFISDVHEELSNLTQAGPSTMPTSYYSPQAATLTALPAANLQLPVAQWPFWDHNSPYTQSETPSHAYSSDSDYSSLGLSTTPTIGIASIAEPDDVMAFAEDPERLSAQFAPAGSAVKSAPAQLSASGYLSLQTLEAFAGSLDLSLLEDSATLGYQSHLPGAPGSLIDDLAPLFTSLDWRYDDQAAPLLELPALSSTSCMGFPSLSTPSAPFSHALGAGPLDLPPTLGVGKRKCDESESQANIDRRLQATSPEPFKKLLNKVKKAELAKAKADTALILGSEPSAKKVNSSSYLADPR